VPRVATRTRAGDPTCGPARLADPARACVARADPPARLADRRVHAGPGPIHRHGRGSVRPGGLDLHAEGQCGPAPPASRR